MSDENRTKLGDGVSIKPMDQRSDEAKSYADSMAQSQAAGRPPKTKPVQPEGMTREEWIASMQPKSTQVLMAKHADPNYSADLTRAFPEKVQYSAKEMAEFEAKVAQRMLDQADQFAHIEAIRRRPKNTLGQSIKSAASPERIQAAKHAFEFSPPAKLTDEETDRVVKLTPIKATPAEKQFEVWIELTPFQALCHWLKGGKVEKSNLPNRPRWGSWMDEDDK